MFHAGRRVLMGWCLLGGTLVGAQPGVAAPVPDLAATTLYTDTAHGCRTIDLATWRHPAREVLRAAQAQVRKVELCNDDRFPVFTVEMPYDPEGHTDSYFNKLYADLADANGFWSYALVDVSDGVVISVAVERLHRALTLSYEHFKELAGLPRSAP